MQCTLKQAKSSHTPHHPTSITVTIVGRKELVWFRLWPINRVFCIVVTRPGILHRVGVLPLFIKEKRVCILRVLSNLLYVPEPYQGNPGWGNPKRQWPIQVNKGIRKPAATSSSFDLRKNALACTDRSTPHKEIVTIVWIRSYLVIIPKWT